MLASSLPCTNFQLVTIKVGALSGKYYFPDLPNLRDAYIHKINVYAYGYLRVDNNNSPIYENTSAVYLTLVKGNDEVYQRIPANELNPILYTTDQTSLIANHLSFNGGIEFDLQKFNFSKSFVEYSPAVTRPAVGQSIAFGVWYYKK